MKANEFFKAMGLKAVKQFLENDNIRTKEMSDELKRLVESHELVESQGGYESAKKELQRQSILRWINPETERLRVAIADVESCQ